MLVNIRSLIVTIGSVTADERRGRAHLVAVRGFNDSGSRE